VGLLGLARLDTARVRRGSVAVLVCLIIWARDIPDMSNPGLQELVGSTTAVVTVAVLAIAVKRRHRSVRDYFALYAAPWRDLLLGLAALLIVEVVFEITQLLFGIDSGSGAQAVEYGEAKLAGMLPALWFGTVIVAPVTEELIFRGFLHRGWAASRLGVTSTILLTSALWAAVHQQYTAYGMFDTFVFGLVLGWIRQRSASTTPGIILHALNNLVAMVLVAIDV